MNICVYCSSAESIDPAYIELATEVGKRLAADGHGLVSGGGRVSMMGAVARAARAGGAHTVGVIPAHLVPYEVADTDADELIVVDTMRERKRVMDERSDAFLALPGGIGTLEELFEVWTWAQLGLHTKPIALLDVGGFYQPLLRFLEKSSAEGFLAEDFRGMLIVTTDVAEALDRFADYQPPRTKWT
jgi:uncharacterized protein (TIGR00730 family)